MIVMFKRDLRTRDIHKDNRTTNKNDTIKARQPQFSFLTSQPLFNQKSVIVRKHMCVVSCENFLRLCAIYLSIYCS